MTSGSNQKESDKKDSQNQVGKSIATWMPIGVGFGVALGLVLDNIALGIAIGAAIGSAVGAAIGQRDNGAETEITGTQRLQLLLVAGLGVVLFLVVLVAIFVLPLIGK
ncbi:MAG: hypothetical protein Kow0031_10610 [Anaerolineae bacterium]